MTEKTDQEYACSVFFLPCLCDKINVIKLLHKHCRQWVDYGRISDKRQQATDVETYIHSWLYFIFLSPWNYTGGIPEILWRCLFRFGIPAHRQRISDNSLPIDPYMKEKQFIDYTYILKGKIDFLSGARMEDLNLSMKENLCFSEGGTKQPLEPCRKKQKKPLPLSLPIPSRMFTFSIQRMIFWRSPISISWITVHRWRSLIWPHIFLNTS